MTTGSYGLFDDQYLTQASEYDSRYGNKVDTLQIHHATTTSISGLISLMMPGGRDVSANGAMANDGTLYEVVPATMRAFTSASSYDRRSLTVEVCNTTLGPNWGISEASHRRLGQLAAQMYAAGLLGAVDRRFIIGHNEVPGSYATACPGPSMNLDLVVQYAKEYLAGGSIGDSELSAAEVEDIKNAIRRDGAARGRLIYDAGNDGTIGWDKAVRAALVSNGSIWPLSEVPADRVEQINQIKAKKTSLILPWAENPAPLTSVEFNREVDFLNDPAKPFGAHRINWIDVDASIPQTTWQERVDGTRYPYMSRQAVWMDLRPVEIRKLGKKISKFIRAGGKSYGVVDGKQFEMTANEVARADAQRPKGQTWVAA